MEATKERQVKTQGGHRKTRKKLQVDKALPLSHPISPNTPSGDEAPTSYISHIDSSTIPNSVSRGGIDFRRKQLQQRVERKITKKLEKFDA